MDKAKGTYHRHVADHVDFSWSELARLVYQPHNSDPTSVTTAYTLLRAEFVSPCGEALLLGIPTTDKKGSRHV